MAQTKPLGVTMLKNLIRGLPLLGALLCPVAAFAQAQPVAPQTLVWNTVTVTTTQTTFPYLQLNASQANCSFNLGPGTNATGISIQPIITDGTRVRPVSAGDGFGTINTPNTTYNGNIATEGAVGLSFTGSTTGGSIVVAYLCTSSSPSQTVTIPGGITITSPVDAAGNINIDLAAITNGLSALSTVFTLPYTYTSNQTATAGSGVLAEGYNATNGVGPALQDTSGNQLTDIATALPAGTAYLGKVGINAYNGTGQENVVSGASAVGPGASGLPAGVIATGVASGTAGTGSPSGPIFCDKQYGNDYTGAGDQGLVSSVSLKMVYVCSYDVETVGAGTAPQWYWSTATGVTQGSTCSSAVQIMSTHYGTNTAGVTDHWIRSGYGYALFSVSTAAKGLCFHTTTNGSYHVDITYAVF